MAKTVVGLFNTLAQAEQVKSALTGQGYEHVTVVANDTGSSTATGSSATGSSTGTGSSSVGSAVSGIGDKISNFFSSLTGGDEDAHRHYSSGVNQGGALLAVTVEDSQASEVASLLKQHGARDIDGNTSAAQSGTPVYGGTTEAVGQTAIPIVEESLVVGKREVDRGGVRVYTHVVERPAEAAVTLRDEFVNVERRYVDRPATEADFAAGRGGVVELTATGEEAVVGKTSRVVEEVLVGKEASQRTENISDTVRRTEVEVEEIPGETTRTAGVTTTKNDRY